MFHNQYTGHMKKLLLVIFALSIYVSHAGTEMYYRTKCNALTFDRLRPVLTISANNKSEQMLKTGTVKFPYGVKNSTVYVQLLVGVESPQVQLFGGEIISATKSVMAVRIPVDNLKEFIEQNNVRYVEISQRYTTTLDESRKEIGADKVQLGTAMPKKLNAEGVIVGVYDTGIDFKHPDFSDDKGTRILYLWDMSNNNGTAPKNFNWGSEYKKSDIDNSPNSILQKDVNGHGTHVAGTAAGNGRGNSTMVGIAPKADLIIIKGTRSATEDSFEDADIIAGCQYIFEKAKELGKPAVVNLSLGTLLGPHDGTSALETALAELITPGNLITVAAGNEGTYPIHAGTDYSANENIECMIQPINVCELFENFCPDIPNIFMTAADVWYAGGSIDSIYVGAYGSGQTGLKILGEAGIAVGNGIQNVPVVANDKTLGYVSIDASTVNSPGNNDGNILIRISNNGDENIDITAQPWTYRFKTKTEGNIDLWTGIPIPESSSIQGLYRRFGGNNAMTIGTPASAKKVISVGSYVTKNEWNSKSGSQSGNNLTLGVISGFSSRGPTRDGRIAPMLTAPGEIIFAAASSDMNQDDKQNIISPDGKYYGISGTSMATPHVTGVIALLLQAKPNLSFEEVENLIKEWSRKDERTGDDLPNNTWGYGKVDAYFFALNTLISSVENEFDNQVSFIHPNPANDVITIDMNTAENILFVSISDITGTLIYTKSENIVSKLTVPITGFSSGLYYASVQTKRGIITKPFTIIR